MKKVDFMLPSPWKRIKVKDATHYTLKNGKRVPTFSNMERQLIKGKV
jgi:hypothetical protein